MNVWQVGLVVRSGLSALVAGGYSARDIGLSRTEIRNGVSLTTAGRRAPDTRMFWRQIEEAEVSIPDVF